MKVLALIPARGGSKGIPGKNLKKIGGMSLIEHAVVTAKESQNISRIIVSTDDEDIANEARRVGAEVPFLRPAEFASDTADDYCVIKHAIDWLESEEGWLADVMVFLRPTNPFRGGADIDLMLDKLIATDHHAIRSLAEAPYPPYWMKTIDAEGLLQPLMGDKLAEARRQALPAVYIGDGKIEIAKVAAIRETKSRFGKKIMGYHLKGYPQVDIDTYEDLEYANLICEQRLKNGKD